MKKYKEELKEEEISEPVKTIRIKWLVLLVVIFSILAITASVVLPLMLKQNNLLDTSNTKAFVGGPSTKVNEIVKEGNNIDGVNLQALYNSLWGSSTNLQTLSGWVTNSGKTSFDSKVITATDIRTKNGGNTVLVDFGGLEWQVTSLTKVTTAGNGHNVGDVIATLWLSNNCQEAFGTQTQNLGDYYGFVKGNGHQYAGLYSDWSADWYSEYSSVTYPSNIYGTSYIRNVVLNAGGQYALKMSANDLQSGGELSTNNTQKSDNIFAKYTMSSATGSLTQFIAKPINIAYQASETYSGRGQYYYLNECYSTPASGKTWPPDWTGTANYNAWSNDYIWLPSVAEITFSDEPIWEMNNNERATYDGATNRIDIIDANGIGGSGTNVSNNTRVWNGSCTRSAPSTSNGDCYQYRGSSGGTIAVSYSCAVRPALHLNLSKVQDEAKMISNATISGIPDTQTYTGNPFTPSPIVVYKGTTLNINTDYTLSYANNTNVTRDASGKVVAGASVTITGMGEYAGSTTVYFTITPKSLTSSDIIIKIDPSYDQTYNGTGKTPGVVGNDSG